SCLQFVGVEKVKTRLRFVGVGDGRGAQIKTLLRSLQLHADRLFLCQYGVQRVLGGKDIEITLCHAQDEVLSGLSEGDVASTSNKLRLLYLAPTSYIDNRLRKGKRPQARASGLSLA